MSKQTDLINIPDAITVSATGVDVTGTVTSDGLTVDGSSTLDDIKLTSVALPSSGNPSIALRNTDNNIYIQTGSGNALSLLDSSQNTLYNVSPTSHSFNISNTERMGIDSSGRVTKPYQPYLRLKGNNGSRVTNQGTTSTFVNFNQDQSVGGLTWSASNGRITIPVAGRYIFSAKFYLWIDNVGTHAIFPRINGVRVQEYITDFSALGDGGNTDHVVTTVDILDLNANDYVDYDTYADIYAGYPHTNLQAYLL